MRLLTVFLWLYRKTIKRVRTLHLALHRLFERLLLPGLERLRNFETVAEDPFWFRLELLTGQHERATRQVLQGLMQPGMVALDVGAHVGYFTRLLAQSGGNQGRVIAIEPHPATYELLRRNTAALPTVTTLQLAATEAAGTAHLFDYLMMSASGSLHYDHALAEQQQARIGSSDHAPRHHPHFEMQRYVVETAALDDCLAELGLYQVDIVKMDIEGAELNALRGMRRLIAASPQLALVMEYNPGALAAAGHAPHAVLQEIMDLGFARMQIIGADGSLRAWKDQAQMASETERLALDMAVLNLLFTR